MMSDLSYSDEYQIHQVTDPVDHAEGPHWKEDEQVLYYVDISGFGVHRYDPYTASHMSITLGMSCYIKTRDVMDINFGSRI